MLKPATGLWKYNHSGLWRQDNKQTKTVLWKSRRLLDNVEKDGRIRQAIDDNITWSMRFACGINEATNTHWVCNIYCFQR
jgi:hypothetical protein